MTARRTQPAVFIPPVVIMVAQPKGGSGKSTLAHHLALFLADARERVLVHDANSQADCYRRLVGDDADMDDTPPVEWRVGCVVVHEPDLYAVPDVGSFTVMIIDCPSHTAWCPSGTPPDILLIPVDCVDAARHANAPVGYAVEHAIPTVIVLNGTNEGGKVAAKQFDRIRQHLPEGVEVASVEIPRIAGLRRAADQCRPVWEDLWAARAVDDLKRFCALIQTYVGAHRQRAARPAEAAGARHG